MIDKLHVRNFRCLRDVELSLGPLNFLVGANNTGKSSLLEAVELLCACAHTANVEKVFADRELPKGRRDRRGHPLGRILTNGNLASELEYDTSITFAPSQEGIQRVRYVLRLGLGSEGSIAPDGPATVRFERVELRDAEGVLALYERQDEKPTSVAVTPRSGESKQAKLPSPRHTALGHREHDSLLAPVRGALRSTPVYHMVAREIATPCEAWPGDMVSASGQGLAAYLGRLADEKPDRLRLIEGALKQLVAGVERVTFPSISQREKTILFHESSGASVFATDASDGLLEFLGYLAIAYAHDDVGVVLIEEPENGVHPRRLRDIVHLLRAISSGELDAPPVQVIATSHSPYLLDCCSKDEVLVFQREADGGVQATPLSEVKDIDERLKDFAPGELIYTMGEGICGSRS